MIPNGASEIRIKLMTDLQSAFLKTAVERGFVHQCTDQQALDTALKESQPKTCYIGFDCTADSLHVGSLLPIMLLRWFQKSGHKPIVLMGGGTTKVGDPSGKDDARQLLDEKTIAANKASIQSVFEKFLVFGDGPTDAIMVDNSEWLDSLDYIPFLRDYGRYFSVNRMLSFESVKLRLDREQPLSFLEFNYMILQAYDFVELSRRFSCILQMGGSDQWGNIVNGVELGRRADSVQLFGLTSPLITTASGAKMGKTAAGAVWLNADKQTPYDYWQFWRNTADADVGRFLRLFTDLPLADTRRLEILQDNEINEAKKILATEATALCHGRAAAEAAANTAAETFEQRQSAKGLPEINVSPNELVKGIPAFSLLVRADLAGSNGDARRLIRGGGARINDKKISNENVLISTEDIDSSGVLKVSAGKKRHVLIRFE